MRTTLSARGYITIPSEIRKKLGMKAGQQVEWIENGKVIRLLPIPHDPIAHCRGSSKGLTRALLESRKKERQRLR